jgi:hypothetical protein
MVLMADTTSYMNIPSPVREVRYNDWLLASEYVSREADYDYEVEDRMTIQEVLVYAERMADHLGIDITIPAVLQFGDLEEITWTFGLYGEDEVGEEIKNRYISAEAMAA